MNDEDQPQEEQAPDTEEPQKGRSKRNRASGKSSGGEAQSAPKKTPEGQRTTRDGKPIRKTASGFTIVG